MDIKIIGFLLGGAYLFYEHLRVQLPYWHTKKKFVKALQSRGKTFGMIDDLKLQATLRITPTAIFSPDDDDTTRLLKEELIQGRNRILKSFPRLIKIFFIAPISGLIVFSLIELAYKHLLSK